MQKKTENNIFLNHLQDNVLQLSVCGDVLNYDNPDFLNTIKKELANKPSALCFDAHNLHNWD